MAAVAVEHDAASAALVRRMVTEDLGSHALSSASIDDVVLVASELVGNAVVHADATARTIDLGWNLEHYSVTFWVADLGDGEPQAQAMNSESTGGRGLAIVAAVSTEWGVERLARGKRVWARIPVTYAA